jgi:hypothetical protein
LIESICEKYSSRVGRIGGVALSLSREMMEMMSVEMGYCHLHYAAKIVGCFSDPTK